jgi:signal transduction histidine kinase
MDILNCNWDTARFLIFSQNVFDPLIYYSHLLPMLSALILGFFVYFQNKKNIIHRLFLALTLCFSVWVFFDLILWATEKPEYSMFFWSSLIYFEYALFALSIYLLHYFLFKRNIPKFLNIILFILFIPIIIFANTEHNLISYILTDCDRGVIEGALWTYMYLLEVVFTALSILFGILFLKEEQDRSNKIQGALFTIGIIAFQFVFFMGNIALLSNLPWEYEQYKLFGILFFLIILIFLIVKFKTFNTKVIGAQALVWIMIILIAAQFFLAKSQINRVLNAITLIFVSVAGYYLVRSVRQVDIQKQKLERANQNQESLLHFITHQVKAYMTKSRNIFDGMIQGDYGQLSEKAHEMARYGFDSETRGVETVQAILKASDLKSGRTEFKKEKANISALVAEIIEFRKEVAEKKHLEFTFDIEPNLYTQVDVLQIKEVFKNIITNAIIYTQKGTIHVTLRKQDSKIRFSVIDTGFGLTSEDKIKLFQEGGKSMDSLKINVDSTGYGLFIARQIVQRHNGKIGALSEGRDKGSEFFVLLPIVK